MPTYTRNSAWNHGGDWTNPDLLWYAKGVQQLKTKPLDNRTSWRYLAGIHGFDPDEWQSNGYYSNTDTLPSPSDQQNVWNQCPHGNWYFLPWHRGYLLAFEKIVRAAIVSLGGPATWALPYWNYSDKTDPNAGQLPPAFTAATLPDGTANPLFVTQRYGAAVGTLPIDATDASVDCLNSVLFYSPNIHVKSLSGYSAIFDHSGRAFGTLESIPHNVVHDDVGGYLPPNPDAGGLMSDPITAGLDPIFWLHHSNIDRLWVIWLQTTQPPANPPRQNPTDPAWLNGPANRAFTMPDTAGELQNFTAAQMLDISAPDLDYGYQSLADDRHITQIQAANAALRVNNLLRGPVAMAAPIPPVPPQPAAVAPSTTATILAANKASVAVEDTGITSVVNVDQPTLQQSLQTFTTPSLKALQAAGHEPDRFILSLDQVRSTGRGLSLDVFINHVDGDVKNEVQVGRFSLFGLRAASNPNLAHGGNGGEFKFDITDYIDPLIQANQPITAFEVSVKPRPNQTIPAGFNITIGQISIYRVHH